ncbi:MAG: prephenate dehydratase, partial [Verrucomicrobia bacterium]
MTIEQSRKAIDRIDRQIIRLLNERTRHALKIGEAKRQSGGEIYAPHREREVLDRVCALN